MAESAGTSAPQLAVWEQESLSCNMPLLLGHIAPTRTPSLGYRSFWSWEVIERSLFEASCKDLKPYVEWVCLKCRWNTLKIGAPICKCGAFSNQTKETILSGCTILLWWSQGNSFSCWKDEECGNYCKAWVLYISCKKVLFAPLMQMLKTRSKLISPSIRIWL